MFNNCCYFKILTAGRFRWRVTEGFFLLDAVKQVHKAKKFTLGLKSPAWLSVSKEIHAKGGRKIPPKLCAIKWRTLAKRWACFCPLFNPFFENRLKYLLAHSSIWHFTVIGSLILLSAEKGGKQVCLLILFNDQW